MTSSQTLSAPSKQESQKLGDNIGGDFEFEACEIPKADEYEFALDENGVYQVYETKKGST